MGELTKDEDAAVRRLRRALKQMPETLRAYVVDDTVVVCKTGVSCYDLAHTVGHIATPCAAVSDAHDDSGYGA